MRIDELTIHRYGIIYEKRFIFEQGHNLFLIYGDNESGKTLTLDALTEFMLPQKPNPKKRAEKYGFVPEQLNRVHYFPEGYVLISDKYGDNYKLSDQNSLYELINLPEKSLRNVFLIRDSDLTIDNEANFYQQTTEHITGMRLKDIDEIKNRIRQNYRLTGQLNFSDRDSDQKLLTRIKAGEALIDEITDFIVEADDRGYDTLEADLISYQQDFQQINSEIDELVTAYYQNLYYRANKYYRQLSSAINQLHQLYEFSQEVLDNWKTIENNLRRHREEYNHLNQQIQKLQTQLSSTQEQKDQLAKEVRQGEENGDELQKIKAQVDTLRETEQQLVGSNAKRKIMQNARYIVTGLTVASLIVSLFNQSYWLWGISGVLIVITVLLVLPEWKYANKYSEFQQGVTRVKNELAPFVNNDSDLTNSMGLEAIISTLTQLEEDYRSKYKRFYEEILPVEKTLYNQISEHTKQRDKVHNQIQACKDHIRELQTNWGVNSVETYSEKLRDKFELERQREIALNALNNMFISEEHGDTKVAESSYEYLNSGAIEDDYKSLEYLGSKIADLQDYEKIPVSVQYSQQKLTELRNYRENLTQKITEANEKIQGYQNKLADIEDRASRILYPEQQEPLICRSIAHLEDIKSRLTGFIRSQKRIQTGAIKTDRLLDEIVQEEQQKLGELFSDSSRISEYFYALTNGNYNAVKYNEQDNVIWCEKKGGSYLEASQLSGFTWDQLYFSIRLVLAEQLMNGEKGFLLLDDPFIKADYRRLRTQIKMLKDIADWGWQIIIFTAKDEVRKLVTELDERAIQDRQAVIKSM